MNNFLAHVPGFRSNTKWKMVIALIYYAYCIFLIPANFIGSIGSIAVPYIFFAIKDREKLKVTVERKPIIFNKKLNIIIAIVMVCLLGTGEISVLSQNKKDARLVAEKNIAIQKGKDDAAAKVISDAKAVEDKKIKAKKIADAKAIEDEILTTENNAELAAVLTVKAEFDPIYKAFAEKYAGRTIEFDGNIANMAFNANYKTRYDILIYAGNYSKTTTIGPSFKFDDVGIYDLHLTGSKIPENISEGQNFRFTARVEKYDENSQLFFLDPVSVKVR